MAPGAALPSADDVDLRAANTAEDLRRDPAGPGLLTVALLSKPAQAAQAETVTTTTDRTTFNQTFRSCTNELVQIQGTLHTVAHSTIDVNDVIHSKFNFTFQGEA